MLSGWARPRVPIQGRGGRGVFTSCPLFFWTPTLGRQPTHSSRHPRWKGPVDLWVSLWDEEVSPGDAGFEKRKTHLLPGEKEAAAEGLPSTFQVPGGALPSPWLPSHSISSPTRCLSSPPLVQVGQLLTVNRWCRSQQALNLGTPCFHCVTQGWGRGCPFKQLSNT